MMYYRISKNEKNLFFGKKNRPGVGSDLKGENQSTNLIVGIQWRTILSYQGLRLSNLTSKGRYDETFAGEDDRR